jgi:hypothetical protein
MSINAFNPQGNTVTFTANIAAPAAVQANAAGLGCNQYLIVNVGSNTVFLGSGNTATAANTAAAVVTTTGPATVLAPGSTQVLTFQPNCFFTGITAAGTAAVYIQPGDGL